MTGTSTPRCNAHAPSATTPAETPSRVRWVSVSLLGMAGFMGLAVELSPAGLLNLIAGDLGVSPAAVGTLTTFFALGNAVLVLPLTAVAIRFARRTALLAVMGVFVVSSIVVAITPGLLVANAGRFLGGGAWAVLCALLPATAAKIAGPRDAVRAVTIVLTANTLGMALGAPMVSLSGDAFGWRATFFGMAAVCALIACGLAFAIPQYRQSAEHRVPLVQAARLPGVLRVCLAWALMMVGHFVVLTYIEAYLDELRMPSYVTSLSLFLLGAGGLVGVAVVTRIAQTSLITAMVAAPAAMVVAFGVLTLRTSTLPVVLAANLLWGIGFAGTVLIYQRAVLLVGHRAPETATSIAVLLAQLGFATGAVIGGFVLTELGVLTLPAVAAVFVLATIVVALTLRATIRSASDPSDQLRESTSH